MAYQSDIFISYRRHDETRNWIKNHFIPLLEHHIFLEIDRNPVIFLDDQLEVGTTWPIALGQKISSSRTIIAMWTRSYLNSKWCSCEIGHMVERESKLGFRTNDNPGGLVFPTIIHDGETMPINLSSIQKYEIQDCYNVRMSKDSPKAEILEERLKPLAKSIAQAIRNAPDWQEDWKIKAVNNFVELYHDSNSPSQPTVPKF